MTRIVAIFAMLSIVVGCGSAVTPRPDADQAHRWTAHRPILPVEDPAPPEAETGSKPPGESPVRGSNTGDCTNWPHYGFPLVIDIEAPAVPPEIAEPAPVIHDP